MNRLLPILVICFAYFIIGKCDELNRLEATTSGTTTNSVCPYPSDEITYDYVPGNCTAFYECDHGKQYLFNCPNNLEWNTVHNYCDFPENVDCSRSGTTGLPVTTPAWTPDPQCPYPSDIITYDYYPGNCTAFYECDHGTRYLFNCPNGLEWNHFHNYCDYPENVDCTRATTTTVSTIPTTKDPRCSGQPDGTMFGDPHDCSVFYECVGGYSFKFSCPAGTEWSDTLKRCDYPYIANCTAKY